jgi:tetratricopeptide (TPR) repeat protein
VNLADALKLWSQIPVVDRGRAIQSEMIFTYLSLGEDPKQYGLEANNPSFRALTRLRLGQEEAGRKIIEQVIADAPEQISVQRRFIPWLSRTGQHERLLAYFEEQFQGDLSIYATRLRSSALTEPPPFKELAMAAQALDKPLIFGAAMQRWRESIDVYRAGGVNSGGADYADAQYWAMAGEAEQSIDFLERAFDKSGVTWADDFADPVFARLRDNPRFIKLREANAALVNTQRELMGWQPSTGAGVYRRLGRKG